MKYVTSFIYIIRYLGLLIFTDSIFILIYITGHWIILLYNFKAVLRWLDFFSFISWSIKAAIHAYRKSIVQKRNLLTFLLNDRKTCPKESFIFHYTILNTIKATKRYSGSICRYWSNGYEKKLHLHTNLHIVDESVFSYRYPLPSLDHSKHYHLHQNQRIWKT